MRNIQERVLDILEAIERIERYSQGGRVAFERNELVQVWILHHLQILGEAVSALRTEFQQEHPEFLGPRLSACGTSWFISTSISTSIS